MSKGPFATLTAAIRESGLSQHALAEKAGVPQSVISRLLAGRKSDLHYTTILKLAAALGLEPQALFSETPAGAAVPALAGAFSPLASYDAACRALAEARTVDVARDVRNQAEAMRIYARQIKDRAVEIDAAEIRIRAERRLGEIIVAQKEGVGLSAGGRPKKTPTAEEAVSALPTLAEIGIDHKLSARCQKLAGLAPARFDAMLGAWREKVLHEHERVTTVLLREDDRATRDDGLARQAAPWPAGRYGVILADPPWRFEDPPIGKTDRSIENHYPTLSLEEICALPIDSIAGDDVVLFLWVTAPQLAAGAGHAVMQAWGFEGRTSMVWIKDRIGMGHYVRNQHEHLLIAKRGNPPMPAPAHRPPSIIEAPCYAHSEKPLVFYDIIERMYPDAPKVELFARLPREGWASWGNEIAAPTPTEESAA